MSQLDRETLIRALEASTGPPATARDIAAALDVPRTAHARLRRLLRTLAAEGAITAVRGPRYVASTRVREVSGRLTVLSDGGAVVVPDGGDGAVAVPRSARLGAVHGDLVVVRVERTGGDGLPIGRVIDVRERRRSTIVGRVHRGRGGQCVIRPFDTRLDFDVRLSAEAPEGAEDGHMVTVEMTRWPGSAMDGVGRIVEVLGSSNAPGVDTAVVLRKYDIAEAHPPDVVLAAATCPTTVTEADLAGRTDFRDDVVVTIDGDHARDFDDAIAVARLPGGRFRLTVHIADVAHYVPEASALDREAFERGTSVYFPERAVHMFPTALATGVCSLKPDVDRLVQTCVMEIGGDGEVVRYALHDGVIHSRARLTYGLVHRLVELRDPALREAYAEVVPTLDLALELFGVLHERRRRRGSIDFDLPEAEVVLNAEGTVEDIVAAERNVAHRIIEECMLLANETVATHLERAEVPALYRVHEAPDAARLEEFEAFLAPLGLRLGTPTGASVHPRDFQQLVERMRGAPVERAVAFLMLRTMQKARYDSVNLGHFGLAAHTYTHFTSPIRRYPDLVVHRLLRAQRARRLDETTRQSLADTLPEVARHASARERRAQEAEREVLQWKKVRFMADKVGETFDGHVTGVAPFGLFVQLTDHFVEGLVHISTLTDDRYRFHEATRVLVGPRSRRAYRLGDALRVRVVRVDLDRRLVELVTEDAVTGRRKTVGGSAPDRHRTPAGGPGRRSIRRPGKRERAATKGRR